MRTNTYPLFSATPDKYDSVRYVEYVTSNLVIAECLSMRHIMGNMWPTVKYAVCYIYSTSQFKLDTRVQQTHMC